MFPVGAGIASWHVVPVVVGALGRAEGVVEPLGVAVKMLWEEDHPIEDEHDVGVNADNLFPVRRGLLINLIKGSRREPRFGRRTTNAEIPHPEALYWKNGNVEQDSPFSCDVGAVGAEIALPVERGSNSLDCVRHVRCASS